MRRSSQVLAPLLASAAVSLLAGCRNRPEMQRCVDAQNRVVDGALCRPGGGGFGAAGYHFYYGGRGSYTPGSVATEGSSTPATGHTYSTTSGTVRGGFGHSFAHGGGE